MMVNSLVGLLAMCIALMAMSGANGPAIFAAATGLLTFFVAYEAREDWRRALRAGVLAGSGAFWLPGFLEHPRDWALLGFISATLFLLAIRVGFINGKTSDHR